MPYRKKEDTKLRGQESFASALVIGGGAVAINQHVPRLIGILNIPYIEIYDVEPSRREFLKRELENISSVKIADYIQKDRYYDLVVISTPPKYHFGYFKDLMECSKNILIEKPIAKTLSEAKKIAEFAAKKNIQVYVNLLRRTLGSYKLIRRFIEDEKFGTLQKVSVFEGGIFNWNAVSIGSFSYDLNGGGVLMDSGPHTLDLTFQVFDELRLEKCIVDALPPAIEANCYLYLKANNTVPVVLALSRNRNFSNEAAFEFDNATVRVGVRNETISISENCGLEYNIKVANLNTDPTYADLFDDFYRIFLKNSNNEGVGPTESLKIAAIIDSAYKIAELVDVGF